MYVIARLWPYEKGKSGEIGLKKLLVAKTLSLVYNLLMRLVLLIIIAITSLHSFATQNENSREKFDPFFDFGVDYSKFSGRITDRDKTSSIFKIHANTQNIKFFKVGDPINFTVFNVSRGGICSGNVRDVESGYFVIYVKNLSSCWKSSSYLRRGTILNFHSEVLARRIEDASLYRMGILKRREDYYKQMNEINHFIWSYDQQKVLVASEFDKKILELQRQKQKAIDELLNKKQYNIHLQKELSSRLDVLDADLDFYRIAPIKEEDRWQMDHHLGKSVGTTPQNLKEL